MHMKQEHTKRSMRKLSAALRNIGRGKEPLFHIVSGTSIGAMNASILVSYVKENKTWEGSAERLIDF